MLKKIITLLLCVGAANAALTEVEQQQLAWLNDHKGRCYDMDQHVCNSEAHIEISRAKTRMRCLELLRAGDRQAYNEFVGAQNNDRLSLATFNKLSAYVADLKEDEYLILRKAVILNAVSLTGKAKVLVPQFDIPNNSLEFSAAMVRATDSERKLYIIFPPQTNFRHMLYAEGGNNMFASLQNMIQLGYMQQRELDLWFANWIVNIAGYRGHINQHGSIYMHEPLAQAMLHLKALLDNMLISPQYSVLDQYLEYRSQLLGLQDLDPEVRVTLAHLGAIMRLYNPQEGRRLYNAYLKLSPVLKNQLVDFFNNRIHKKTYITHAPAMFANGMDLTTGDIELVVAKLVPVYAQAINLSEKTVSLNTLSSAKNVSTLLAQQHAELMLNPDLEVALLH